MELQHALVGEDTPHQAGRKLLQQMYTHRFGAPMPPILKAERGKPYFLGNPVYFSITHTPRHVFCALSDQPVGIDAEEQDRQIRQELAKKILSPNELARYEKAADKNDFLLRLWVLKEALGKCTGEGINGWPVHTDLDPRDKRLSVQYGCIVAVIQEETDVI